MNFHLFLAVSACVLGSAFQHGYNIGVVNAPQALIQSFINQTYFDRYGEPLNESTITLMWSWIVSIFCVGGMLSGFSVGYVADRLGRKGGLLINNGLAITAGICLQFSKFLGSFETLLIGRFLIGINCGLNAGLAPLYLCEISPRNLRGAIGTVYQLVITISILISQVFGLDTVLGTETRWPSLLGLIIFPAILQLCLLPFCPESPKFYLMNLNKEKEAYDALYWLRGSTDLEDELIDLKEEFSSMQKNPEVSLKDMFTNPILRSPLMIAVMMMLAQQFSGINAVIYFSTDIFKNAGLPEHSAQLGTIGMGITNVMMTLISLAIVERAGRKTLMLSGIVVMLISMLLLTIVLALQSAAAWFSFAAVFFVILFIIGFATGPGSIPWFLVTELFNQSSRPLATSIAVGINWVANFIVGLAFLPLAHLMGSYVFVIFTILLLAFAIYTHFMVPETKNKSLEQITEMFSHNSRSVELERSGEHL